jgi:hypothetical protein
VSDAAAAALLMQWFAVMKKGAGKVALLRSVPVHRNCEPPSE